MWVKISDENPPEGVSVNTKIDDGHSVRNEQFMTRQGRLYFVTGGTYVYYTPTHWFKK